MKNRIVSFQILRAVAITLIFLSHCEDLIRINDINCLKYLGGAGVSLFIALSGFLIAMKYDGSDTVPAFDLYKKRWKQFYKNHYLTLMIAVPLTLGFLKSNPLHWLFQLITNVSLTQSLIPLAAVYFSFNAVSWYLSLMLCFALLTPIAVRLWNHMSLKAMIILSIIITLFEVALIIFGTELTFIHWLAYIFPAVRFLDFIIGGGYWKLGKYIKEKGLFGLKRLLFWISCVIMTACMVVSCYHGNNYFLTAVWTLPTTILVASLYNTNLSEKFYRSLVGKN